MEKEKIRKSFIKLLVIFPISIVIGVLFFWLIGINILDPLELVKAIFVIISGSLLFGLFSFVIGLVFKIILMGIGWIIRKLETRKFGYSDEWDELPKEDIVLDLAAGFSSVSSLFISSWIYVFFFGADIDNMEITFGFIMLLVVVSLFLSIGTSQVSSLIYKKKYENN